MEVKMYTEIFIVVTLTFGLNTNLVMRLAKKNSRKRTIIKEL